MRIVVDTNVLISGVFLVDSKKILNPIAYQTAFNARLSNIAECFHNLLKACENQPEGEERDWRPATLEEC